MTLHPELEALIQGAIDDTLRPDERETLDRLMTENLAVRGRVNHLRELTALLDALGPAEPPATLVQDVLAEIADSTRQSDVESRPEAHGRVAAFTIPDSGSVRPSVPRKEVAMNKNVIFGLAAAAVLVLAIVTFTGAPPASQGTEATIGAAQRYRAPQIEAKDVAVGDTSAQAVLQTDTWDQIVKDDTLRTLLQDASFRAQLQEADLLTALADPDVLQALRDPNLSRQLTDAELVNSLGDAERLRKVADADLRSALQHQAFLSALRDSHFRAQLADPRFAAALAGPAFQNALRDRGFEAALSNPRFAEAAMASSRCPSWLCSGTGNSPIVDGARMF